jgi:hypothetical protein
MRNLFYPEQIKLKIILGPSLVIVKIIDILLVLGMRKVIYF